MKKETYHHGNLKESMIENGISIINEDGIKSLSLRKVAKLCNVSHAAPYKHFENKEMLLKEIQNHIAKDFANYLNISKTSLDNNESMLLQFGINYVSYFIENPAYYKFLFNQPHFKISITNANIKCDDFPPFSFFIDTVKNIMKEYNISDDDISLNIIVLLSVIDGLTSILISENVEYEGDYKELVSKILTKKIRF